MPAEGKKILIVEDEREYAEMVKLRLDLAGYDCTIAETTQEGASEIRKGAYDLMVLDLMLPGGGGFALLNETREERAKSAVPVVVLTGKSITSDVKTLIGTFNISALFTKPYDPDRFLEIVNSLIETDMQEEEKST
jgi:DNA-binding response OmpR family regulator